MEEPDPWTRESSPRFAPWTGHPSPFDFRETFFFFFSLSNRKLCFFEYWQLSAISGAFLILIFCHDSKGRDLAVQVVPKCWAWHLASASWRTVLVASRASTNPGG
jgi:hypothetical protein